MERGHLHVGLLIVSRRRTGRIWLTGRTRRAVHIGFLKLFGLLFESFFHARLKNFDLGLLSKDQQFLVEVLGCRTLLVGKFALDGGFHPIFNLDLAGWSVFLDMESNRASTFGNPIARLTFLQLVDNLLESRIELVVLALRKHWIGNCGVALGYDCKGLSRAKI